MPRNIRRPKRRTSKLGKFKSPLEKNVSKRLPKGWEYESEKLPYYIEKKYIPDFIITTKSGHKIYLEVKGYLRYEDQKKMRAVKQANPDLDIRFFFPREQKVHTSEMTNTEWCTKYGFPVAIERFPRNWFK